jgi:pSer/pThr/pTyr-binding forkhead associated (FHA) protein
MTADRVQIGRRSVSRGIDPEIDLSVPPEDPGVSRLHAVLLAQPDGSWTLVDVGSANGTTLNDDLDPIPVNVPVPVKDGDRVHVGAWTTITLKSPDTLRSPE